MPGNFHYYQHVQNGRVEWPWGPLTVDPGFNPTWLQSWVVQGGPPTAGTTFYPGPAQSTNQSAYWSGFTPGYWIATEPGWLSGSFTPGQPAVGIAVLAVYDGTNYKYEFWVDPIMLY
jgi:hypothetical protein